MNKRADKQIGGFARAAALTPERRKEIALNAITKRWAVKKAGDNPAVDGAETVTQEASTHDQSADRQR